MVMLPFFILMNLLFPVAAVAFFGWLALRYVRSRERAILGAGSERPSAELGRIEETLESLQREVQTLQERQTFVEKLLERPREPVAGIASTGPVAPRAPADPHL